MAIITKRYAHLNQADSGSLHRKLDATEAYITGSLTAASTLDVAGAAEFQSTVHVQGAVALDSSLEVTGSAILGSTLEVQGNADMRDVLPNADLSYDLGSAAKRWNEAFVGSLSALTVSAEVLSASVDADLNGTLHVEGQADFAGAVNIVGALDVDGASTLAALTGSAGAVFSAGDILVQAGKVSASSDLQAGGELKVAGNSDLNGSLDVALASDLHGAVTAYSTLNVQGAADLDSTLNVDGIAEFQDDVYAKADLNVSGALEVALTANVAGNFSVATNKFTVAASSGDTAIAGDLIVSGDLTVMGDRIEAQVTQLVVEDGLITLMSGSTSRAVSNDAGIEVEVGSGHGDMPAIKFASAIGGQSGSWVSNLDWIPAQDLKYDLGIPSNRWRELNLSGDANVGGALDVDGAASLASIDVAGEALFDAGIAVTGSGSFSGDLSAASGSFTGDLDAQGEFSVNGSATIGGSLWAQSGSFSGDVAVVGGISATSAAIAGDISAFSGSFGGDLTVIGTLGVAGQVSMTHSASISGDLIIGDKLDVYGQTTLAELSVTGLSDLDNLNVAGSAEFAQSIAVTGSGSFTGDLTAASASFSGDLDVYGTATFHGTFAVPGTGDFGSLVVGGINMSPISSSNPVSTVNASSTTMLTQQLVAGDMAKYEIEVIARGASNAASWKISVAAMHDGTDIQAAATELSKEFFGALGANLDVDVQVSAPYIDIIAKGADSAGTVYWDCQIVKKMVLDSLNGARKY